jgi:hypothetical protein
MLSITSRDMNFEKISRGKAGSEFSGGIAMPCCPHLPRDLTDENKGLPVFQHRQDATKGQSLKSVSWKIHRHFRFWASQRNWPTSNIPSR